ncbi:MAG: hypothetical protein HKP60_07995, partial [Eudoraea sp.]|nr:hypothetical protein [Eudoraea sp.]NNJ40793.1 hypothetical protein [Eudoraea sp.]
EQEAEEKVRNEHIKEFQQEKAKEEQLPLKDKTTFSKALKMVAIAALLITLVLASVVLFGSEDQTVYEDNRNIFYRYAFICTLIYFITAYWAFRRGKDQKEAQ